MAPKSLTTCAVIKHVKMVVLGEVGKEEEERETAGLAIIANHLILLVLPSAFTPRLVLYSLPPMLV